MPAAAVALCLRSVLRARSAALPLLDFLAGAGHPFFLCFIPCRVQLSAVMPLPLHMRLTPVACSASGQTASTPAGRSGSGRLLNPDAPAWYPPDYSASGSALRTAEGARVPAGVASLQDEVGIPPFAPTPVVGPAMTMGFATGSDVAASQDFDEDDRSDEESRPPTPDSIAELLPELHEYRSYLAWLTHRRVIVYKYVAARRRLARLGLVRSPFDLYATICTFPRSPVPAPRCPA